MSEAQVTILIPNYKTFELTRFCLRQLRLHTDLNRARVIVIDNDSNDASLEYLRQVRWIELIERHDIAGESGPEMHARALDLGLTRVTTPLVMVMHTDTIVTDDRWLDFLTGFFDADPKRGGVGSWKLETVSPWKTAGKCLEEHVRRLFARNIKVEERYLRSHCALYRTEAVRLHSGGFFDGKTAGLSLHRRLEASGYSMLFLESSALGRYLRHLNHATMILNPRPEDRKTAKPSARRRILRELKELRYDEVAKDSALDQ